MEGEGSVFICVIERGWREGHACERGEEDKRGAEGEGRKETSLDVGRRS